MANTVIQLKNSGTPTNIPGTLATGEIALNYADGKFFYKNATGQIVSFAGSGNVYSFATVNANNYLITALSNNSVLTIKPGNNIEITGDIVNDIITVNANITSALVIANAAFDKANTGAASSVTISATPPVSPYVGQLWWNSDLGRMFVWYSDVDSSQWVETSPSAGTIDYGAVSNSVLPYVVDSFSAPYGVANSAFGAANQAGVIANGAFGAANQAGVIANSAFDSANTAGASANTAGASANTAGTSANTAGTRANTAGTVANGAFGAANQAGVVANSAFGAANQAGVIANSAFGKANAALANATGTFSGDLTVTGNVAANRLSSANGFVDLGPGSIPTYLEGRIYYDNVDKSLNVYNEESGFIVPLGQKEYVRVYNNSGVTLSKGKAVYATGYHTTSHQHPTVALADASDAAKYDVLGLVAADIADGAHGYVIVRGWIGGINTSNLTVAKRFHLGYASPGTLVTVSPEYPNYPYDIGYCVVSDATNGYLYIDRQSHTQESIRVLNGARIGGDMTVEGDFTVLGTQTVTSTSSLAVGTQYVYLSAGDSIPNANITFTGSGLNDATFRGHYEGVGTTNFYVKITEANVNGDYFSLSYNDFSTTVVSNTKILYQTNQLLSNGISVYFQANTGHTIGAKWNASVTSVSTDAGFVTNHTDPGRYTHAGLFRDATDGAFKFFNTYDAEPAGNIDIANNTFSLGNVEVLKITAQQIYAGATEIGSLVPSISTTANAAFASANQAGVIANSAFGSANTVGTSANTAGSSANQAGVIANSAFGKANNALANTSGVNFNGSLYFPSGCVAIGIASTNYPLTIASGAVTPLTGLSGALAVAEGSVNGYNQFNIRNGSNASGASSDYIVTADDGSDTTNFLDLGINNSNYNAPASWTINGPRDGYLYVQDSNLSIGSANTTSTAKFINFFLGGSLSTDEAMRIQDSAGGANVGIGRTNPGYKLDVVGTVNASSLLINQTAVSQNVSTASILYVIDGGGIAITTGEKGHIEVPFNCTINNVTVLLDQSGSINVAIQKDTFANFPPTAIDTINSAGFVVTTATNVKVPSSRIATTTITAGDILAYNVTSIATATRATISIQVTKT